MDASIARNDDRTSRGDNQPPSDRFERANSTLRIITANNVDQIKAKPVLGLLIKESKT